VLLSLNSLYIAPLFLKFKQTLYFFLGASNDTKTIEIDENLNKFMPFENEEGDLQKLNITIQFVFLSLNFLYVFPLPSTFKNIF